MKIYLASPFFNEKELEYVTRAEEILRSRGFDVFSPREHEDREHEAGTPAWAKSIFLMDRDAILSCDRMVMLYHGNYSDTGTAWECGFASAIGIPIVVVHLGKDSNLMVHAGCKANISMDDLSGYDFQNMPSVVYTGAML